MKLKWTKNADKTYTAHGPFGVSLKISSEWRGERCYTLKVHVHGVYLSSRSDRTLRAVKESAQDVLAGIRQHRGVSWARKGGTRPFSVLVWNESSAVEEFQVRDASAVILLIDLIQGSME